MHDAARLHTLVVYGLTLTPSTTDIHPLTIDLLQWHYYKHYQPFSLKKNTIIILISHFPSPKELKPKEKLCGRSRQ